MVTVEHAIDRLHALIAQGVSGELICASPRAEVHVYLQRGRIAWATDSQHPFAFAAHLQQTAQIDPDTFRQVVEECRRERLPLGETLVEWGLATHERVRASLMHQISAAIEILVALGPAQTLFLERGYPAYDEALTFRLEDLSGVTVPPPTAKAARIDAGRGSLARQLRASVDGLAWVDVLDVDRLADADPDAASARVSLDVLRATLLDGADFAAIRTAQTSVVGFSVSPPRSIWAGLAAGSMFGAAVSAMWTVAGSADRQDAYTTPAPGGAPWTLGETTTEYAALLAFRQRAQDVLGAVVLARDGDPPVAGCGIPAHGPDALVEISRRRRRALCGTGNPSVGESALDALGFAMRTMVSGEAGLWCFGAELQAPGGPTLWLFIDRRNAQGLGWAYVTALARSLRRAHTEAA